MRQMSGKKFEGVVKESAQEQGFDYNRLRDAGWTGEITERRFTIKNICDITLFKNGKLFYIECKSSKDRLAFNRLTQQEDLIKKFKEGTKDVHTGYLLQINGQVFYISAYDLDQIIFSSSKVSVNSKQLQPYKLKMVVPKGKTKPRIDLSGLPLSDDYE